MEYNYIAFSLWGDKEIYTTGAIRNAELAAEIYAGWKVIIYYDHTVPTAIVEKLSTLNVILINMTDSGIFGAFWRFTAVNIPDSKYIIFRDTDSRLSMREKLAVEEWMRTDHLIHVMRDHPAHFIPYGADGLSILAGMWGAKSGSIEMAEEIKKFCAGKEDYYGIDQAFLQLIYTKFKNSMSVHDEFFDRINFPSKRVGYRFIGERIDEHELPSGEDWKEIRRYNKEHHPSLFRRIKTFVKQTFK